MAISKGWTNGILIVSLLCYLICISLSCFFLFRKPKSNASPDGYAKLPNEPNEGFGGGALGEKGNKVMALVMHLIGDVFLTGVFFSVFIIV